MSWHVPPWVYPAWDSLHFLDLVDHFLSHVREIFSYFSSDIFSSPFSLSSLSAAAAAKSFQLCPTLCDPIEGSPPGFSIPRILQARILEWVVIPSPEDLPDPGTKTGSPALQADSLPFEHLNYREVLGLYLSLTKLNGVIICSMCMGVVV